MRNRVLSIVLAISMIAVVFAAVPTTAETSYTGSVKATDVTNAPKDNFIQGELIYFSVQSLFQGNVSAQFVTVTLYSEPGDGWTGVAVGVNTNATTGWYNSSSVTPKRFLQTNGLGIGGDVQAYDLVASVGGFEIGRYGLIVKKASISLDPSASSYWPGQAISWTLVTSHMTENVYVQILNATDVTVANWTVLASTGRVVQPFTIGQWKDGNYGVNVRYASNHSYLFGSSFIPAITFSVSKYDFLVTPERTWYLPGENALIDYLLVDKATQGPPSGVTINFWAQWWEHSGGVTTKKWLNNTLPADETLQNFSIPATIALNHTPAVQIDYWANGTNRSIHASVTLHVDVIVSTISLNAAGFLPGDTVVVQVNSFVSSSTAIPPRLLPGASVVVTVTSGTGVISDYAASLTTNSLGAAGYSFVLNTSAMKGTYVVKADVSKLGFSTNVEAQFTVTWSGSLIVTLDKASYVGGETLTVTFDATWNREKVTSGTIGYRILLGSNILVVDNTTGTSVKAVIPMDFSGIVSVTARTVFNEVTLVGADSATVILASMDLQASKDSYRAGDTIKWSWTIVTGVTGATLSYEIIDSNGVRVADGAPGFAKTGSFTYRVPSDRPASLYQATMRMVSPSGAPVTDTDTVTLVSTLELRVWVDKSPNVDGMFAPGQTVTLRYSIDPGSQGRSAYRLHVAISIDPIELDVLTNSESGKIAYKVPKTATVGQADVTVDLYDAALGGGPLTGGPAQTSFVVNNRESVWGMSIGGLSLINLVLLVLLIVVVLVLIIMPFMKGRMNRTTTIYNVPPAPPTEPGKMPPPSP